MQKLTQDYVTYYAIVFNTSTSIYVIYFTLQNKMIYKALILMKTL
jgi:hypothetical protein